MTQSDIASLVERVSPIANMMLADEAKEGRQPIYPSNAPDWFDADDWNGWPVMAISGGELHIIAIWSKRVGALTRLIAGARSAGLSPVIVEPMGDMLAILARWGWKGRVVGSGFYRREEWRPKPLRARTAL